MQSNPGSSRKSLTMPLLQKGTMSTTKRKANEISEDSAGWTIGPSDNFSDWVVEVVNKKSGKEVSYHVHRKDLSWGKYKSEYFSGVFNSKGLKESSDSVTRVELDSKVAEAFPIMLNFLYTGNLNCKSKHIVALFWLADYFMIESLKPQLKQELRKKVNKLEVLLYIQLYQDAVSLNQKETLDVILEFLNRMTQYIMCHVMKGGFLQVMSPAFFLSIRPINSYEWYSIVCEFISYHKEEIDNRIFEQLVDRLHPAGKQMSVKDMEKVIGLLKYCPKVEGLPHEVLRKIIDSVVQACTKTTNISSSAKLELVWKALEIVESNPVEEEMLSTLHDGLIQFFTDNPSLLSGLAQDKVSILHQRLPGDIFVKLFITMQTQCNSLKEANANQRVEHGLEVAEYKQELKKFQRFDAGGIKDKIQFSHVRYSEKPKPDMMPQQLPRWGDQTKKGWMYVGYGRPRPLYMYTG
jgi:hypothetical protein